MWAAVALLGAALAGDPDHGAYLAHAGQCASCHTADAADPYGGGVALETRFGTFYGTNLTPAALGDWTLDDFVRAMRRGKAPDGRPYYPAFPYPSFTRMTEADLADLFAWVQTLEPSETPNRAPEVKRRFRGRFLLSLWRLFEFRPREFRADPDASETVDRGAYLVQGPGHCGECHTPRNGLGAMRHRRFLAGNDQPPEPSPNITPHPDGIEGWDAGDLETLLELGMLPDGDWVGSGMTDVVDLGTAHLTDQDRRAIAEYLLSVRPRPTR